MKIDHKYKVYITFFGLIILFFSFLLYLFVNREKTLKSKAVESVQANYAQIVGAYVEKNGLSPDNIDRLDSLFLYLPQESILSLFDEDGNLIYHCGYDEQEANGTDKKEAVEVKRALLYDKGSSSRKIGPDERSYFFYAVQQGVYIVRIGLPVDRFPLNPKTVDLSFLLFCIILFVIIYTLLTYIYVNFIYSVRRLKSFILSFGDSEKKREKIFFEDEELNEIQSAIIRIYDKLKSREQATQLEREKLLEHFHFAEEGISFFTPDYLNIYTNVHFIQYLNVLLNRPTFDVSNIFGHPVFSDVMRFLENPGSNKSYKGKLHGGGKCFNVHTIIFDDRSFEIIIRKMTAAERDEMDAAAMTDNIAHELRTPVTGMRGYLETMMMHENMDPARQRTFVERAYKQCLRLNEIIQDVILLSKTIYAPQFFLMENINVRELILEIVEEEGSRYRLKEKSENLVLQVGEEVIIRGNRTLLSSIFRNLISNALKYAGDHAAITINNYLEDSNFYYFSFFDDGPGVEENQLDRIFERFYRVSDGRTRDKGGSGLGLAIVKDAVVFHHGEILAKNRQGGGLEYLFTLRKR